MAKFNLLKKLSKPEYIPVFPFLSISLMIFYFFFYCRGENIPITIGIIIFDTFTGYVIALLSLLSAGLYIFFKKGCSVQYLIWYIVLTAISFLSVQYLTYAKFYPSDNYRLSIIILIVSISIIATTIKIIYERFKLKQCWMLLLLAFQLLSFWAGNVLLIVSISCLSIGVLTAALISCTSVKKRVWYILTSMLVYLTITIAYLPYNPIWSLSEINSFGISFKPLRSTLIIEENGKYHLYSGRSLIREPIIDIEFDTVHRFKPYVFNQFVGLKHKECNNIPVSSEVLGSIYEPIFPITVSDSCAYFAADISVFQELSRIKDSDNKLDAVTADIYYKYLAYFNQQDSTSHNALKKSYSRLQYELTKSIKDLLSTKGGIIDNPATFLRNCSRQISLGLLNAYGSDLINNHDFLSAFKLFSLQFLLTFHDNPYIYQGMRFNLNIKNGKQTISFDDISNLSRENDLHPWTKMVTAICALAQGYSNSYVLKALDGYSYTNALFSSNPFDEKAANNLKNSIDDVRAILTGYDYEFCPTLKQYINHLQSCLYQAIIDNNLPEYNAYFVNRLQEVAPIVCMDKQAITIYNGLSALYVKRFNEELDSIRTICNEMDSLLDQRIKDINAIGEFELLLDSLRQKDKLTNK